MNIDVEAWVAGRDEMLDLAERLAEPLDYMIGAWGAPPAIGGVLIAVLVLTPEEAADLVEKSQWFMKVVEKLTKKYMDKGMRYTEVPGVKEYWVHKTSGSKNEDEFYREWCEKYGD